MGKADSRDEAPRHGAPVTKRHQSIVAAIPQVSLHVRLHGVGAPTNGIREELTARPSVLDGLAGEAQVPSGPWEE